MENIQSKISLEGVIIVRSFASKSHPGVFYALASARGKDVHVTDGTGAKGFVKGADLEKRYDVKLVRSSGEVLPEAEGIYVFKCVGDAWVDKRKECNFPTIWIKPELKSWECDYKRPLPKLDLTK